MDLNACIGLAVGHFKDKKIENISMDYESAPQTEDHIHPLSVYSSRITLHFTDGTNMMFQAEERNTGIGVSAHSSGIKEPKILVSFWGAKDFQNQLSRLK